MLGLLWAVSSFSTNFSTASIEDEARSRPYNEDTIQIIYYTMGGIDMKLIVSI